MSFWRRIWGIFNADNDVNWSETVKGGVEASEKIFALAEAVNKKENKEFLKSIMNYPQSSLRFDWGFCRFNSQSLANPPHRFDVCFCSED